jgi:SAM-dependent methyltransferase
MTRRDPWADPASLTGLDRMRKPFHGPNRRIIRAVLDRFLGDLGANSQLIEVGCGLGQLRAWLPEMFRPRLIHTEPSAAFLDEFRRRHPDAAARQASVYRLPWLANSLHGVLALCVLDTLDDLERAREEIRRVLAPGAKLIHWLDLGTDLGTLFRDLVAGGEVPLPNFLAAEATATFDDLLLTPRSELARLVEMLRRHQHPAAGRLASYLRRFTPPEFDPVVAAPAFMGLVSDGDSLTATNALFREVYDSLQHPGASLNWPIRPYSSLGHFRDKVERLFGPQHGFGIEMSELVSAREVVERESAVHGAARYLGRCVGRTISRVEMPPPSPGVSVAAFEGIAGSASTVPADPVVVESAVYVFVAAKAR